jgi:hypothetical protein
MSTGRFTAQRGRGPIRTYAVSVDGYGEVVYSARTPGKARARAYRDFTHVSEKSFGDFLRISRCRRISDPPGAGERIVVADLPATRCLPLDRHYVYFMRDDSDEVLCSHPLDVTRAVLGP